MSGSWETRKGKVAQPWPRCYSLPHTSINSRGRGARMFALRPGWMGCQHRVTKCKGGLFLLPQNFPKQQTPRTLLLETVATPAWTNLLNACRTNLLIGNHSHSATPPCRPFLIGRGLTGGGGGGRGGIKGHGSALQESKGLTTAA